MRVSERAAARGLRLVPRADRSDRRWLRQRTTAFVIGASLALWGAVFVISYWLI